MLAPTDLEVASLGFISGTSLVLFLFGGFQAVNVLVPCTLVASMGLASWNLVKSDSATFWTPLFSFRVGVLVFYGIGGFLPLTFDPATRDYELMLFAYSSSEAAKVNLIWATATFLVLTGALLTARVVRPLSFRPAAEREDRTLRAGVVFFGVGFGFFLLVELPQSFGFFQFVLPGSLLTVFQAMNAVGAFLIALWGFERGGRGYVAVVLLFLANVFAGLVGLNKSIILFPQLLISLAYLMKKLTVRRVLAVAAALTISLSILQPMISHGRAAQMEQYQGMAGGTLLERLGYAVSWFRDDSEAYPQRQQSEEINPLLRLSYHNVATYVVTKYDLNQPSDTIKNSAFALIPRVLWPNKPYTTAVTSELFYEISGQEGSALSPTVPPDVYWNLGWWGVILIFPMLGVPLMLASRRSYLIVASRDWIMMPFVLIVFRIALSVDGTFVAGILVPGIYAMVVYLLLKLAGGVVPNAQTRTRVMGLGPQPGPS
jgi:hypothetical protein